MLLLMQVATLERSGSHSLAAGLRSDFTAGLIYCSPITKRLIVAKNRVPTERVQPLELDRRHVIDGVGVTLIDANHCPGAAMMLFEVPSGADGAPGKVRPAARKSHTASWPMLAAARTAVCWRHLGLQPATRTLYLSQ
jgi:Cft2 family RNA processing exonuclease